MDELIITVASVGGKWRKEDSPYVPLSPEQIAEDILQSFNEGATIAHIHARDEAGIPSRDPKYFRRIIEAVKKHSDILIQISTGYLEGQIEKNLFPLLEMKPDMASLNVKGSLTDVSMAAEAMKQFGVKPAIEAYDIGMIEITKDFLKRGIIEEPIFYEVVFNIESKVTQAVIFDVEQLISRVKAMPEQKNWSVARGGENQLALGLITILLGGHVRVGLEDNLYYEPGVLAKASSEFVRRIVEKAHHLGRNVADIGKTRRILKI
jgi:3-keto-5-aminohexanoate cleavage enzyme